jgi:hypothetical protein
MTKEAISQHQDGTSMMPTTRVSSWSLTSTWLDGHEMTLSSVASTRMQAPAAAANRSAAAQARECSRQRVKRVPGVTRSCTLTAAHPAGRFLPTDPSFPLVHTKRISVLQSCPLPPTPFPRSAACISTATMAVLPPSAGTNLIGRGQGR